MFKLIATGNIQVTGTLRATYVEARQDADHVRVAYRGVPRLWCEQVNEQPDTMPYGNGFDFYIPDMTSALPYVCSKVYGTLRIVQVEECAA